MLKNVSQLTQLEIRGKDAPNGHPIDALIDESDWSVRALALRPGWHSCRKIVVPVSAISKISWENREARLALDHNEALRANALMRERPTALRSCNEISGYRVRARGEPFGYIEDFVMDTSNWVVRYLVVETSEKARPVHLAPQWAAHIDWSEREVHLDVPLSKVQNSPVPSPLDRSFEERLYDHYGHLQMRYWIDPEKKVHGEIHAKL